MSRLRRPLDEAIVKKTDEEFYANHPELVKDGKCRLLDAKNPKQVRLREEWVILYNKNTKKNNKPHLL